jgi:hypothetical protein
MWAGGYVQIPKENAPDSPYTCADARDAGLFMLHISPFLCAVCSFFPWALVSQRHGACFFFCSSLSLLNRYMHLPLFFLFLKNNKLSGFPTEEFVLCFQIFSGAQSKFIWPIYKRTRHFGPTASDRRPNVHSPRAPPHFLPRRPSSPRRRRPPPARADPAEARPDDGGGDRAGGVGAYAPRLPAPLPGRARRRSPPPLLLPEDGDARRGILVPLRRGHRPVPPHRARLPRPLLPRGR